MDTIDALLVRDTQVTPAVADLERAARAAITAGSRGIANNRVLLHGLATAALSV